MSGKEKVKHESKYFTVMELAEGVYAAIEKDRKTGSNAGIIDLGDFSIMFDTFLNIDAARELVEISRQLGCSDIRYVVNSHFHADHIVGNSLFKDNTSIIGSAAARVEILKFKKNFEEEKVRYAGEITELNAQLANENDPVKIADIHNELKFLTNLVKPGVGIYPPNLEFEGELVIHGSRRSVHLIAFEKAHSKGDVIAYLPEDGICFAGDLVFGGSHPWLGSGEPESLIEVLKKLLELDITCCVSGHGRLAGKAEIKLIIKYIEELLQLVAENDIDGSRELTVEDLSADFREWNGLCFSWNVNFLKKRMQNMVDSSKN